MVHKHFGVQNEASLRAYLNGEFDDKEFIRRRVWGMEWVREEVKKWTPEEVERVVVDFVRDSLGSGLLEVRPAAAPASR